MIGPSLGGSLFAWSMSNGQPWPLNFHLVWYLQAAIVGLTIFLTSRLPLSIDRKFDLNAVQQRS